MFYFGGLLNMYIDSFRLHFISIFRHRFKEQLGFVSRNN